MTLQQDIDTAAHWLRSDTPEEAFDFEMVAETEMYTAKLVARRGQARVTFLVIDNQTLRVSTSPALSNILLDWPQMPRLAMQAAKWRRRYNERVNGEYVSS